MTELTHHAYYVEGSLSQFADLAAELKPQWARRFEAFGVDDARQLVEFTSLKNIGGMRCLVGISSITSEAQQALLKLFEEPTSGTTFVVLLPHGVLLPTLRSRMLEYPLHLTGRESSQALAFLQAPHKTRSDIITKLLKDDEGAKERARDLINALEAELAPRIAEPAARKGLADLALVRDYLRDRSPSLKMLLEHLALALPKL